jgi:sugar (pentulose or hexulose) kinase
VTTTNERIQGGRFILVLDVGTTGTRAALFDATGELCSLAYREYSSQYHSNGRIDHDPQTWWRAITEVVPEALERVHVKPNQIEAISVTSQRATILPVDHAGEPLTPAISWQDKRTLPECKTLSDTIGQDTVFQTTGLRIDPYFSLPKVLWFQKEQPRVYREKFLFLTVHDWIVFQLTGCFATEWTQASRTQLMDIRKKRWSVEFANEAGLRDVPFPDIYPTGTAIGGLLKKAADVLHLIAGTPVILAGGDQQCAAVGLSVVNQGDVKITTGTGSFVVSPVEEPVLDAKQRVLCSLSAIPNQWVLEAGIFTTGAVLRWWRNEIAKSALIDLPQESGPVFESGDRSVSGPGSDEAYAVLTDLASTAQAGSGGAVLIPHFTGSAAPYWNALSAGVLFGLSPNRKFSELSRAILEGIALEINKNLEIISEYIQSASKSVASVVPAIRVTGGLTKSVLFNQIQADVFGYPVTPGKTDQATALGAATIAFVSLGVFPDIAAAAKVMCSADAERTTYPNPTNHLLYQRMQQLHHRIYTALADAGVYELAAKLHV